MLKKYILLSNIKQTKLKNYSLIARLSLYYLNRVFSIQLINHLEYLNNIISHKSQFVILRVNINDKNKG